MKKNKIRSICKQCTCALALSLLLSTLLACGDETSSSKDEKDMVTTETNNQDLGTGGNQTATENSSSLHADEATNDDGIVDDLADGASDVIDGVSDGVSDVADGIADGVSDVTKESKNDSRISHSKRTTK